MTTKKLWIGSFTIFILFIIASTPASIALSLFPINNGVEISGVSGSIWSGKAQNVNYHGVDFGNSSWKISPWSLFLLSINAEVHSKNTLSTIDASLSYSMSGVKSDSIKARFPASWIPKLTTFPFQAEGNIQLRIIDFEQAANSMTQITGSVALQNAAIQTPFGNKAKLGDLQINISSTPESILLDLKDNRGPLGLNANIIFTPPNKIIAKGSVNQNIPVELANFFRFFSKPDNKGNLLFNYNGIIPGF